jgi:DNA mismatch repair protein MutS2
MKAVSAALEFDRLLRLVASFARSQLGRRHVLATTPSFEPGEGARQHDLTQAISRLVAEQGALTFVGLDAASELTRPEPSLPALMALVQCIVDVRARLGRALSLGGEVASAFAALPMLDPFLQYLRQRIGEDGEILDTASPALAQARAARERLRTTIVTRLEQLGHTAGASGPYTVRRERYCLPVPVHERSRVPGLLLDVSASKATAFIEPMAVVELNNALAEASAQVRSEEDRVRQEVLAAFTRRREELEQAAARLALLDATQARVLFGQAAGAILLRPGGGDRLRLLGARHPLLVGDLASLRSECFGEGGNTGEVVPLDFDPPPGVRVVLLSGPNAGGKTVALKTVGLAVLMAQAGIPVLAEEGSLLPEFSGVWCHIGDEQSLLSDLSTFSAAMRATARLLEEADERTLVLYDELGSGTDPEEGAALAAALLEELLARRCFTLATAHLTTVAAHLEALPGAANAAMGFDQVTGGPTFRLQFGSPGRSHGLAIARRSGVPQRVLQRARELVSRAFLAIDSYLQRLDEERRAVNQQRRVLLAEQEQTRAARRALEEEREAWRRDRVEQRALLEREREQLRQRARTQLEAVLEELRQARAKGDLPGRRRLAALRSAALDLSDEEPAAATTVSVVPGERVRVAGTRTVGEVMQVVGERVQLSAGGKRLWVAVSACEPVAAERPDHRPQAVVNMPPAEESREINLIGLTTEEAREALERFLDHALLAGTKAVRIVHGHGSGALRRLTRDTLSRYPGVLRFAHPAQAFGGTGVTEAELE